MAIAVIAVIARHRCDRKPKSLPLTTLMTRIFADESRAGRLDSQCCFSRAKLRRLMAARN
jgi:hypothetical protein